MKPRLFEEVRQFSEESGASSQSLRRALMIGSLSPLMRWATLGMSGVRLGAFAFTLETARLTVDISSEAPVPPVGWWSFTGEVTVRAHNAPFAACNFITALKGVWPNCSFTSLEFINDDEVEAEAHQRLLEVLFLVESDLRSLQLDGFYLENVDTLPRFARLSCLFLDNFRGEVERWSDAFSGCGETVEICSCASLSSKSFESVRNCTLNRLVLDSTNISPSILEKMGCVDTIKMLSLMDCGKMTSLRAEFFPELRQLFLARSPITTESLTSIDRCRHLKMVNLGGCKGITDLSVFAELKGLRELFVHETSICDKSIANIARCVQLEKLNVGGCVAVSNVNPLGQLHHLVELHLWSTRVSNQGIEGLSACHSLAELVLDGCPRISNVSPLSFTTSLKWLSLIGTNVDTEGVRKLIHCSLLETLALAGTRIPNPPKLWNRDSVACFLQSIQ